jgi:hypothetical protein
VSSRRKIPLEVTLDGRKVNSETTCMWAGPYVLVIATTLPDQGLALDVTSTFVGHEGVPTCATHLILGPVGHAPLTSLAEHEHANLDPKSKPRECGYEHMSVVLETLKGLGYRVEIDVRDDSFGELERVEA